MRKFKWFSDVTTAEECKKRFRQLCKDYHPDNYGNEEIFKEIQNEFSFAWEHFKNIHHSEEKGTYTETENVTTETSEFLMNVLTRISTFSGIEIEFCGTWIWLSGNTFPYKDELAKIGFKWSKSKHKWYIAENLDKKKYKKGQSMEKIRQKYGSKYVKGNGLFLENA